MWVGRSQISLYICQLQNKSIIAKKGRKKGVDENIKGVEKARIPYNMGAVKIRKRWTVGFIMFIRRHRMTLREPLILLGSRVLER